MKIYIAGPYSASTLLQRRQNCLRAVALGALAMSQGHTVIIPHTMYHMLEGTFNEETFLEAGLVLLGLCDEIWVCDGYQASKGTMAEIKYAIEHGIPIVYENELDEYEIADFLEE